MAASKTLQNVAITGANKGLGLELCRQMLQDERYGTIFALCRKTSDALTQLATDGSSSSSDDDDKKKRKLTIVSGLDLMREDAFDGGSAVTEALATGTDQPTPIHVLIHNAGGYGPPEDYDQGLQDFFQSQSLDNVTPRRMTYAFQLNAMTPLFLTKALLPNLKAAAATTTTAADDDDNLTVKVIIMTSLMGSISDNTSGSIYAYRASKAAVNMVGKTLSCDLPKQLGTGTGDDLKPAKVAVGLVHPGAVFTNFAPNTEPMSYQRPVDVSIKGVLEAIHDKVTMETTGQFWHGNYGEGVKASEW